MDTMPQVSLMTTTADGFIYIYSILPLKRILKQVLSFIIFLQDVQGGEFARTHQHFVVEVDGLAEEFWLV